MAESSAVVSGARIESVPEFHDVTVANDLAAPHGMDALHPVVQEMMRSGRLETVVRKALDDAKTGEGLARVAHALGGRSDRALPLHVTEALSVYAAPVDLPRPTVDFIESRVMNEVLAVLGGGDVELRLFDIQARLPIPILTNEHTVTLRAGDTLVVDARTQTYSFESTGAPSLILLANSREVTDIARRYDAKSLVYGQTIASSQDTARLRFALQTFAMLPSASALDAIDVALEHRAHFIRWYAMDALTMLDSGRARAAIEKAAVDDPDPMLREAAAKTLAGLRRTDVAAA